MKDKKKFFIVTTVPVTLRFFKGQIQVLKKDYDVELISSPGNVLDQIGEAEDVVVHGIEMKREISVINDIKSLFNLYCFFRKLKPYIVHGNTPKGGFLSMFAAFLAKVPKRVYCVHGLRYEGSEGVKGLLLRSMEKLSCFFASEIVAVSFGMTKTLKNDGITAKPVHVIGNGSINGIDLNYFSSELFNSKVFRKEYHIDEEAFVYGFVGRLVGDKGVNELVKAFVGLCKEHTNLKLLLVGKYEEKLDPLEKSTIDTISSHPDIINVGFQKDIRPYLAIMDVFTFPSYREGFGVSIMEAGAMGIPTISSNISGCNEIVIDGVTGMLMKPKSIAALEDAMRFLKTNPAKCNTMAAQSREQIASKYEQKVVWTAVESYYKSLSL